MIEKFYKCKDRIEEWLRYSQPSRAQKKLLGMYTDVIDTEFTAIRIASEESAKYVLENMRTVPNFDNDYDFHQHIVSKELDSKLLENGQVLEFGVATGRTLNHIARLLPHKKVYGFDCFTGLPEDWHSRMRKGFFARDNLPRVRKNCELVVGLFDDTLPGFLFTNNSHIALLHVDCDLYSSAKTVLSELKRYIVPGTVIIFDEYINYPGWQLDEFKAWQEFVKKNKIKYEYIGRVSKHQKVAVRIL